MVICNGAIGGAIANPAMIGRERPIKDLRPMSDVAMAISTDVDTDVAYLVTHNSWSRSVIAPIVIGCEIHAQHLHSVFKWYLQCVT